MDMTDVFAGLAMQGLLTHPVNVLYDENKIAEQAYDMVEAMIKERDKRVSK